MGRDKAALRYGEQPQSAAAYELAARCCARVFLSTRRDQAAQHELPQIHDELQNIGPMSGILAALHAHPDNAWLVLACDLPLLTEDTLRHLIAHRDPARLATAYRSSYDRKPEPLCAIYEPAIAEAQCRLVASGEHCPRKALATLDALLIDLPDSHALDNVNLPHEFESARAAIQTRAPGNRATGTSS